MYNLEVKNKKALIFFNIEKIDELAWPTQHEKITRDSSALEISTDFTEYRPLIIEALASAVNTKILMKRVHVRLKLIVGKDNHFLGVVSLET